MEVYILDSLLRRSQVVDKFESLIWTERFSEIGDFELSIISDSQSRRQFVTDTKLAINNSYRVMNVETVEDTTDEDGKSLLKVKGRSLEAMLEDRVAKGTMTDLTTEPTWDFLDPPGDIARQMYNDICVTGVLDSKDIIPFAMPVGTIVIPFNIPESGTPITVNQAPDSLYNAIKDICDKYDLGFTLVRLGDTSQLHFFVYPGNDRTSRQTDFPAVIFSANLDNLQNTTEFNTVQQSKNVAYVFSEVGFEVVYGENVDPDVEGFERRVLMVDATDVTIDTPDISAALVQKGIEELAKNRAKSYFDGEISEYGQYQYGVDYNVGDLVELRNIDGIVTYKRVTEQIFVDDKEGERSYPTLSMDMFSGAVTWLSYFNKSTVWEDFTTEFWEDM